MFSISVQANNISTYLTLRRVDVGSPRYKELKNNIAKHGLIKRITVRRATYLDGVRAGYILCDGIQRLHAVKELINEGHFVGDIPATLIKER